MAYEELKSSGITASTPENIMLGAGTIHKGLAFADGKWNFEESLIGATSGGNTNPLSSPCVIIIAPIILVDTPHEVW